MLLQSLYEFAKNIKTRYGDLLINSAEFESRYVAWLIHIDENGVFKGFIPLITDEDFGKLFDKLPRTLEPKDSGTVAEFLVEDILTIFGIGESPSKSIKDKAQAKHENFWQRIHDAANELNNRELKILLKWKENIKGHPVIPNLVYEKYKKPGSRGEGKEQWIVVLPSGEKMPLFFRQNASIDATIKVGNVLPIEDEKVLSWWSSWYQRWLGEKENACFLAHGGGRVCSITGDVSAPMSNSHLPKLKRIPDANPTGSTIASAESDSFHSYGLSEQQEKIPGSKSAPDASYTSVSVKGAIAYCNALNYLLRDDNYHISVGPVVFCFWCKRSLKIPGLIGQIFNNAYPEHVKSLLGSQFAGIEPPEVLRQEHLYTLALSGNAGRAMVKQWIDQTLDDATKNLNQWWQDVQVIPFYSSVAKKMKKSNVKGSPLSPYRMYALAETTLRRSKNRKNEKLVGDRVIQLYLAALKGSSLPIILLKPILDEFQSALVKESEEERTYPFSTSRFALIKLILLRNPNKKEDEFMPTYELADTPDPAYNLGRVLAVFENLQDKYHNYERKGAGIVERYYGTASSAPASSFPLLCRLARHHLSKLKKGEEKDKKAADAIEKDITEIFSKFQPTTTGQPPVFPRILTLEEQGKFALGFYQQKAKPR
ncbi:MAG: type I-C CRISPR-associated protein Cas8c/Csd1 [Planctomycetes bacterium]|uniref:type I-C CRISPR-associated protein Cas8c/Csd1 n=1 Tax=Candidatus Wunengus sp. YC65 TaxID=3367701 RepID=UPI001D1C6759|nr:type I-C CRISPR-associated protein Cas8c/Csd1 [Planctomycetota bacterium]